MTALGDMAEILDALIRSSGTETPTFQRMVRWYRAVADELGCRADYDRLLAGLLAPRPRGTVAATGRFSTYTELKSA